MPTRADWQAALAICAAIIGAGFASGREIVSFFSGFGSASWLGISAASAGIGTLVYTIMLLSRRTGSRSFPELYGALMGKPCQDALHILHGLLCLLTASSMLAAGAELGALAFPCIHSRVIGFLLTLLLSIGCVCSGFRALSSLGGLLISLMAAYFIAMAMSGRYTPVFSAEGLIATLPMGLIYASFNGALAGGTVCLTSHTNASPSKTAFLTALVMFFLLSCANAAMLRAGDVVLQMTMPSVALSSKWGVFGYYASIVVLWLAVLTTLCAMLHSLRTQLACAQISPTGALLLGTVGASLLSVSGFEALVSIAYPLLGWVCGIALVALMLFLPALDESPDDSHSADDTF